MYNQIYPEIQAEQARIEGEALVRQPKIEKKAMDIYNTNESAAREFLTKYSEDTALKTLEDWQNLSGRLIVTYRNGNYNDIQNKTIKNIGYPDWWYNQTQYQYGPRVYDIAGLQEIPGVIYTGQIANITGDPIVYIKTNQT